MYKKNGRVTYRSNRRQSYKRSNSFSNGKLRNKGNVIQQYQKYLKLAKEASSSGDRIQTEYFFQFTDHYSRLMQELGISFNDNENNIEGSDTKSPVNIEQKKEKIDELNEENTEDKDPKEEQTSVEEDDHGSIESVSFLSDPTNKKSIKSKKEKK